MKQPLFVIVTRNNNWTSTGFAVEESAAGRVVAALNAAEPDGPADWQVTSVAMPATEIKTTFADWQERNI